MSGEGGAGFYTPLPRSYGFWIQILSWTYPSFARIGGTKYHNPHQYSSENPPSPFTSPDAPVLDTRENERWTTVLISLRVQPAPSPQAFDTKLVPRARPKRNKVASKTRVPTDRLKSIALIGKEWWCVTFGEIVDRVDSRRSVGHATSLN